VARSSLTSAVFPLANLVGALAGGVLADRAARRPGGRIRVQAFALLAGAPFIAAIGSATRVAVLVAALIGVGLCKGVYDANIFASLYDVVGARARGAAAGLMNTAGWTGGSIAPLAVGLAADRFGLSLAIASTAAVYGAVGVLALAAAGLAARTHRAA
jgi:MFS family permease